jgi:dihydroxy-acid dehydratase
MSEKSRRLRSESWWNDSAKLGTTASYLERYLNYGLTLSELQAGKPIIGIAQTGSDLSPCNRHHLELAKRIRDGIRDAGGIPLEFPVHPIQETGRRPTAALDRNLAYLGLVEILFGYPLDGVVLTTGCDKTTPAMLMGAATVDLPAIVFSGGPMLDGHMGDKLVGSGHLKWEAQRQFAAGKIDQQGFFALVAQSAPSIGHCNSMGTASSMNALAEALGMSLPGCAAIPAPYRERAQMAYESGKRIVGMVHEDLRPSRILTRQAFENAVVCASALGASTNCPPHLIAIARHAGVALDIDDWDRLGYEIPLLVNMLPAGKYLGESYFRAGGLPAVISELARHGKIHEEALTVTGRSIGENNRHAQTLDPEVIRPYEQPIMEKAGFAVLKGNLFDSAIMKTSVISETFRKRYLERPGAEGIMDLKAVVFDGPEDYRARINDPALEIDADCVLVIRNCGPIGYPGSAESVNMLPPDRLVKAGISELPCLGDGRQSGTSGSPSILNASPESAAGGGLALLRTGDRIRIDVPQRRADMLISDEELARRRAAMPTTALIDQTPWQAIYRAHVGQLGDGAILESAAAFQRVDSTFGVPRDNR